MTDPRIALMQPVHEPLHGPAARSVGEALHARTVKDPLWGEAAKRVGEALRRTAGAVRSQPAPVG